MALPFFKKKSGNVMDFRGKSVEYQLERTGSMVKLHLGHDGKLKNSWNDKVWVRVELDKETNKITIYSSKADAGASDGKILYANYAAALYPDFFSLEENEIKMLVDFIKDASLNC